MFKDDSYKIRIETVLLWKDKNPRMKRNLDLWDDLQFQNAIHSEIRDMLFHLLSKEFKNYDT